MSQTMVFQSDNYNLFNMIKGNRELDMVKIKKILADIERGTNLLKYCPILVVEKEKKLNIIDGQHRFVVSKKVKSPVYYIMAEDLSLYDIARMNSNTEKWKASDFINCYKTLKNSHYIKLDKFLTDHPGISVTTALSLLGHGRVLNGGHSQVMDRFQKGEFKVEHEEFANNIINQALKFEFKERFSRHFLVALNKILVSDVFPMDELAEKVNDNIGMLQPQDHWRKYLTNLEEIASKGKHKRVAIY
jgi:hypothetical protein